jgi:hypothetical protein
MEPLPNETPHRGSPPLGEKLIVGCGLFILLVALFVAAMAFAFQRACSCATHVVAHQSRVVRVPGNLDITLLAHRFSGGTPLSRPYTGLEYLITRWKVHNPAKNTRRFGSFTVVSGIHVLGPERNLRGAPKSLPLGALTSGRNALGWLVFEVEKHAAIAEINYRAGNFEATWQFPR